MPRYVGASTPVFSFNSTFCFLKREPFAGDFRLTEWRLNGAKLRRQGRSGPFIKCAPRRLIIVCDSRDRLQEKEMIIDHLQLWQEQAATSYALSH
jgi:hypothetical protein